MNCLHHAMIMLVLFLAHIRAWWGGGICVVRVHESSCVCANRPGLAQEMLYVLNAAARARPFHSLALH